LALEQIHKRVSSRNNSKILTRMASVSAARTLPKTPRPMSSAAVRGCCRGSARKLPISRASQPGDPRSVDKAREEERRYKWKSAGKAREPKQVASIVRTRDVHGLANP
jgi:hypothetical protein